jgi:hypothetical protein
MHIDKKSSTTRGDAFLPDYSVNVHHWRKSSLVEILESSLVVVTVPANKLPDP